MSFNAIRDNKILAKISEFTVHILVGYIANSRNSDQTAPKGAV